MLSFFGCCWGYNSGPSPCLSSVPTTTEVYPRARNGNHLHPLMRGNQKICSKKARYTDHFMERWVKLATTSSHCLPYRIYTKIQSVLESLNHHTDKSNVYGTW